MGTLSLRPDYITKGPEHLPVNKLYRYQHQPNDLFRAISNVLERVDNHLPPPLAAFEGIVGREPYPVSDKAGEVIARLRHLRGGPVPLPLSGQPLPQ